MIVDKLDSIAKYKGINKNLDKALEFIHNGNLQQLNEGRTEIDGDTIYCNYNTIDTNNNIFLKYEAHKKYIDIHICLGGTECIKVASVKGLKCTSEYDDDKDIQFFEGDFDQDIILTEGTFLICFSDDAHAPLLCKGAPGKIKKVIVKVAY